jgi:LysR family nitrogen assimilation transcriptional regulator
MELRQLKYFIGIVDAGSLTRAAQHLHIAQPALSAQIVNLEAELGVQLLVRSVRGVTCTDAGTTFYKHAQQILRSCKQAADATRSTATDVSGNVAVGLPSSVTSRVGVALLSRLAASHPNVRLQLTDSPSAYLVELLMKGRLDIAILFADAPIKGLVCQRLFTENLLWVRRADVSAVEPLLDVSLADLAQESLMLPIRPNALRLQVEAAFTSLGLAPRLFAEVSAMAVLAQCAATGVAGTITSWSAVAHELDAGLVTAQKVIEPEITRTLALCHPDLGPLTPAAEIVRQTLQGLLAELVHGGTWRGGRWIDDTA